MFWPREYGGRGSSYVDYVIFLEEIARRGSPGYNAIGAKMLAPTLIEYGTEEQKGRHLEPIAQGEEFWCEGFSEPEAGSDLASLKTRARKSNGYYLINGQKTWSTFAQYSQWCCLLARTDPESKRHRGLSFFLVDLSSPGITVRPIENLLGDADFCEIFFEDVKVPKENLVGEEGQGWQVAQTFLSHERVTIAPVAVVQTMLERLCEYLRDARLQVGVEVRHRLAQLAIEAEVGRLICYRVAWLHDRKQATEWHAAMSRLYSTQLWKRATGEVLQLLGLYGLLDEDVRGSLRGWFSRLYLASLGATVAAGTSEIQKNIIALRGLGLPRG